MSAEARGPGAIGELVRWFGEERREALAELIESYREAWGATGPWRCRDDLRWATHVLVCDPWRGEERRWAVNLLARIGVRPEDVKGMRCRERH